MSNSAEEYNIAKNEMHVKSEAITGSNIHIRWDPAV